jgi:hypothetical protein
VLAARALPDWVEVPKLDLAWSGPGGGRRFAGCQGDNITGQ